MKYSIFYLIKGQAGRYNQKLVKEVGPKFGERYMIENKLPSHITLKAPFETDNIKEVEEVLRKFAKKQKPSKIKIDSFGNFKKFISFLKTKCSKQTLKTQKELIKEFEHLGINPQKFDKKWKPHATIAYGNKKETFNKIWSYLKTLEKPNFDLIFDNITIMKKEKKRWKVYKEFKL